MPKLTITLSEELSERVRRQALRWRKTEVPEAEASPEEYAAECIEHVVESAEQEHPVDAMGPKWFGIKKAAKIP